ncbi:MAG: SURF1 family protein [Methylococcaceae bacterium]|nr:SURF1 family protein [Methylococcaceae bacterium]
MKITVLSSVYKFNLISGLFFLLVLTFLILLGFWQLGRADEKRSFLAEQKLSINREEVDLLSLIPDDLEKLRYRKTKITGHYDQHHQFLIDNQIVKGQAGYFVMTPLVLAGMNKAVLVNRGWVPLNKDRLILPDITIKTESTTTLAGRINNFPVVGMKLPGAEIPTESWPSVVQLVDINILSKKLGVPLFPFQVELDPALNEGFLRDWKTNLTISPEKHVAYAVQWFGLAVTLTILFIRLSRKSK